MREKAKTFLEYFGSTLVIIYFFEYVFPANMELGNMRFNYLTALLLASFLVALIVWSLKSMAIFKLPKVKMIPEIYMDLGIESFFGTVAFWLVARGADFTGFGISRFWVAILLGIFLTGLVR